MKRSPFLSRLAAGALTAVLFGTLVLPTFAFPWSKSSETPSVSDFSKNGLIGAAIPFEADDFKVTGGKTALRGITVDTLPEPGTGTLVIGNQPLTVGTEVDQTALGGLRFQTSQTPTAEVTTFTFTPTFVSGAKGDPVTVTLHILAKENQPPIARNMELSTYRNIAITGCFDAVDNDGDILTFRLTSTPARGAVELAEDGSGNFVYTPYENKTGNDAFTYVAVDSAGNISPEGRITVRIEKAETRVTYADLEGHSAHKAAIRLAEAGIFVGQRLGDTYFFDGDAPVTRAQFLTMAMAVAGLDAMDNVTLTAFADDEAIPTWAKGQVSAALKAGAVQGSRDDQGAPVFGANDPVTRAEATVMLDRLLNITDVPVEVFFGGSEPHWAAQAAANLAASGVISTAETGVSSLSLTLTRAEAAELLDGAMDLAEQRLN